MQHPSWWKEHRKFKALKQTYLIVSLVVAGFFLAYDLWLIGAGLFHPATLVGVVLWLALLMFAARCFKRPEE